LAGRQNGRGKCFADLDIAAKVEEHAHGRRIMVIEREVRDAAVETLGRIRALGAQVVELVVVLVPILEKVVHIVGVVAVRRLQGRGAGRRGEPESLYQAHCRRMYGRKTGERRRPRARE